MLGFQPVCVVCVLTPACRFALRRAVLYIAFSDALLTWLFYSSLSARCLVPGDIDCLGGVPKRHTATLFFLVRELKHPVTIDDAHKGRTLTRHFYVGSVVLLCAWE